MDFRKKVRGQIKTVIKRLPKQELAVLELLIEFWGSPISQGFIASSKEWFGSHRIHETHLSISRGSTFRQVRQNIRNLRVTYGIPIISGTEGYRLPLTLEETQVFVGDLERKAKASAAAYFETYKAMKEAVNITSSFFEK